MLHTFFAPDNDISLSPPSVTSPNLSDTVDSLVQWIVSLLALTCSEFTPVLFLWAAGLVWRGRAVNGRLASSFTVSTLRWC